MSKGVGEYQIKKAQTSEKQILHILSDGQWHRYQEIQKATKLSTATLSKHLKKLEKGLIEKRLDLESGEYPYPVYYRLKKIVFEKIKPFNPSFTLNYKLPRYDLHLLNELISLTTLEFLRLFFKNPDENEELFQQAFEHFVINRYREAIFSLKEMLKQQAEKGENIEAVLQENIEALKRDYSLLLKAIALKDRRKVRR